MRKKHKLVCGVGINDADYVVCPTIDGKQVWCPFYQVWVDMLKRGYSVKLRTNYPTYSCCTICEEWLTFSNFKAWMEKQDWEGKQLDKDLLIEGNKVYSPDTCVFVDALVNCFILDNGADRGEWPIGVCFNKPAGKFQANCNNPFTKKLEYLGIFTCPEQAHKAWRSRKHELALQLADLQTDDRVKKALSRRYAPNKSLET